MSTTTETEGTASKGLKLGAIGLVGSIVVGIASTAPAYSLAATLGFVVATENGDGIVGVKAPLIMVIAFIPMYLTAVAYSELNKAEPDCGTTFTWAARAFGPRTGFLGGWAIIIADIIVMANLAQIAGSYTYSLFGFDSLASSVFWSTVAGIVWIAVMTYICYRGIEVSVRLQYALLGIEIVTLVAFALFAIIKVYASDVPTSINPSLDWFSPSGLTVNGVVTSTLIAVFIYWGWDTAVTTNEESDDPARTPGRAAVISTILLLLIYAAVAMATVAFAGVGEEGIGLGNLDNASDVFAVMGESVFGGGTVGWIMVHLLAITVLTSASASTQTTILPTARTSLSMAVFKAAPARFARIHPKYLTPTDSTIWMGGASILFYVGLTLISENILADTIEAVGLMIAFYYGLTGFACVWFYRKTMWSSPRDIIMQGLFPLLGGVILLVSFVWAAKLYTAPDWGAGGTHVGGVGGVFLLGIGSLLVGFVFMFIWQSVAPAYFRGETLPKRDSSDLILVGGGGLPTGLRLPDSAESTVIAPDLSNLPPGQTAIDPRTGERYVKGADEGPPP